MDCGQEILKKVEWKVSNRYGQSFKIRSHQNLTGDRPDRSEAKQESPRRKFQNGGNLQGYTHKQVAKETMENERQEVT
jgi:hypothetical protein